MVSVISGQSAGGRGARRLSELDALRGFAMLLGVVLHAALSFFPTWWPVQDRGPTPPADEWGASVWAIHGFRMPLFFLLSGFFSAMLWRRRGLGALLLHRLRRVALPLAIAMVTIVPLTDRVTDPVGRARLRRAMEPVRGSELLVAVAAGDTTAVARFLDEAEGNADADARGEPGGWTLLHYAAHAGQADVVELLLARGADPAPVASAYRGETPMMLAFYFGHERVADVLARYGGGLPLGPGMEWSELQGWAAGASGLSSWFDQMYHLWFLWVIVFLVAGFAPVALIADRMRGRQEAAGNSAWPRRVMFLLIPLTLLPQLRFGHGGMQLHFGPDTFTGLAPPVEVLIYYALFFAFGVLWYGRRDRNGGLMVESLGRGWWLVLPVTFLVVLPLGLAVTFVPAYRSVPVSQALQVLYAWGMCIGLIGLFRVLLSRKRGWVRYLSDASYWIYLAHVPLVIAAQRFVRDWPLPAAVKFLLITAAVLALLLLSYQAFVRHTPIGALLNGRSGRPERPVAPVGDAVATP